MLGRVHDLLTNQPLVEHLRVLDFRARFDSSFAPRLSYIIRSLDRLSDIAGEDSLLWWAV